MIKFLKSNYFLLIVMGVLISGILGQDFKRYAIFLVVTYIVCRVTNHIYNAIKAQVIEDYEKKKDGRI